MNFGYRARVCVRLPIRSPPPSLALTGVSKNNLISRLQVLTAPESVRCFCSLLRGHPKVCHDSHSNLSVVTKDGANIFRQWLKLIDLKGLQLLLQSAAHTPPAINIPGGVAVWAWCIINHELHYMA